TADHGCDPTTPSTDHSREYTPLLVYGERVKQNTRLGTRSTLADIGQTVAQNFSAGISAGTGLNAGAKILRHRLPDVGQRRTRAQNFGAGISAGTGFLAEIQKG